jgi:hypothetical protein
MRSLPASTMSGLFLVPVTEQPVQRYRRAPAAVLPHRTMDFPQAAHLFFCAFNTHQD